jgi:hypothetical protein
MNMKIEQNGAVEAVTVDTPEFRAALQEFAESFTRNGIGYRDKREVLIAYIDAHTAKAVAQALEAQQDALTEVTAQRDALRERLAALQQHAQAALSDVQRRDIEYIARQYVAAVNDPHISAAGEQRWLNQLDAAIAALPAPPQEAAARDERADFEAWAKGVFPDHPNLAAQVTKRRADGEYEAFPTQREWDGWQARAVLAAAPAPVLPATGGYATPTEGYVLLSDCDEGHHPKYGNGYFFTENCIKEPSPARGEDLDIEALQEQAGAWIKVFFRLNDLVPDFLGSSNKGVENALFAIDRLVQQGRDAGLEEAAKYLETHHHSSTDFRVAAIRALNKQEPTA